MLTDGKTMEVIAGKPKKKLIHKLGMRYNSNNKKTLKATTELRERRQVRGQLSNKFEPKLTNLWDFSRCDPCFGFEYPGRMPGQIVQNLLYYYTEKDDLVVDPFAGSGTTIDVCKIMKRRCVAFDLNPLRRNITQNNVLDGIPVGNCNFIILDPPYWLQKKGAYTDKHNDLSNMSFDNFMRAMKKTFSICYGILVEGGHIAFISSPAKTNGKIYDIPFECYKLLLDEGFKLQERIIVPYRGASSITGYWLAYARKSKTMLRAYRDLLVLKKMD